MSSIVNQSPYLRTTRSFPDDAEKLSDEVDKAYLEIAQAVNFRTIGIFPTNKQAVGGEQWNITNNQKQQNLRQVYTFTATTTFPIPHGIKTTQIDRFVRMWGTYTDAAGNWYGIIGATNVVIPGQFTFYITPTNIVFLTGAGAPVMVRGEVILEWLSLP